jgi:hypothetical protein
LVSGNISAVDVNSLSKIQFRLNAKRKGTLSPSWKRPGNCALKVIPYAGRSLKPENPDAFAKMFRKYLRV